MTTMREMTGGMAIVESLIANGVDTLFGIPGAQMYSFFDALVQRSDRIRTLGARHEQTCGYMAFGYARSTGRPGVFSVVPGPGILNAGAALVTALGCNAPVLCVTGQVPAGFIGKGRGHLHEIPDQLGTLRKLTKWSERIERVQDAPEIVNEAFRQMLTGRPGPVAVEMAWDTMASRSWVTVQAGADIPDAVAPPNEQVEAAARLVVNARRPMIMTGSGAQHASLAVRALAEELDAPVFALRGGRGVMPEDEPLGVSNHVAYRLWPDTDLLIGIGSRLEVPYMRWTGIMNFVGKAESPPHLIRIDIDPEEMSRLVPHSPIVADSGAGAVALLEAVRRLRAPRARLSGTARARIAAIKASANAEVQAVQPQMSYLRVIRETLPRDGILVGELCQVGFASYFGYPVYAPRTYISEGFQGTLGAGFPTALGVKAAHPDRVVVSITGDGGFMFAVQELATAVQENIALITILFNNQAFGNVLRDQKVGFDNRTMGSLLTNPDFQILAKAFGVAAARVRTPSELEASLKSAIQTKQCMLIEVEIERGSEVSPWSFINPPRTSAGVPRE